MGDPYSKSDTHCVTGCCTVEDRINRADLVTPDALCFHFTLNQLLVHQEVDPVARSLSDEGSYLALVDSSDTVTSVDLLDSIPWPGI